jgi:pimeloyl-ACP methyl ester carboxylesterase
MSNVNLNETAPTQFQDIGGVRLAYRNFGKEGAPPVVCFQHLTGNTNTFDPIHTNRLAQDRPVIWLIIRVSVSGWRARGLDAHYRGRHHSSSGARPEERSLFGFSISAMVAQQIALDAPTWCGASSSLAPAVGGRGMQELSAR